MRFEPLHYDAESRVIYDENRLAVARDVAPDLGAVFAMALAYRQTLDEIRQHAVNPGDRAHDVLSQEADSVEGQPAAVADAPPLWAILDDMLAYEAEQFDGDQDSPLDISGADLVDAFTTWRGQLRAAGAGKRTPPTALGVLKDLARDLEYVEHVLRHQRLASSDQNPKGWRDILGSCAGTAERLAARAGSDYALTALERIAARLRGEWHDPTGDLESDIAGEIRKAGLHV